MGLFKRKVIEYDTEASMPQFEVDANGFIIFKNKNLGGCGIFEITPCVTTESMTHTNSETHEDVLSQEYLDALMEFNGTVAPNVQYDDARRTVYPAWIAFLNSLHPEGGDDDPIHTQILVKKVIDDEWATRSDYARNETEKAFADTLYRREQAQKTARSQHNRSRNRRRITRDANACIQAHWNDYNNLLQGLAQVEEAYEAPRAYKAKMYLVISYTPSSEGWWFDGRDSDYYITDNDSATNLFQEDKWADRFASMFMKRKGMSDTAGYSSTGATSADEVFWVHSDMTAQIIETRMEQIEDGIAEYRMSHRDVDYPFMLRRLEGIESAGLICMFPNIMSHYWDEMWDINTNINDVLYRLQYNSAVRSGNADIISGGQGKSGFTWRNVRMDDDEAEEFLKKFAAEIREKGGPKDARQEHIDDVNVVSQKEIDMALGRVTNQPNQNDSQNGMSLGQSLDDIWGDFGDGQLPDYGMEKTQAQKDEEFLSRFRNRSYTIEHQLANAEIFGSAGIDNKLNGTNAGEKRNQLNGREVKQNKANQLSGSTQQGNFRPETKHQISTRFGTENAALALEMDDNGTPINDRRDIYMGKKPQSMTNKPKFRPDDD